jgi:predicted ABC-type ATPase
MLSPDKIFFLKQAQSSGFRAYLYYIATDDPEINIERGAYRVQQGDHSVPILIELIFLMILRKVRY